MAELTWPVGDFTVTKLVELEGFAPGGGDESALPDARPEAVAEIAWLIPHFATEDGQLGMSVHALLIESPQVRLVVDTCIGNDKTRAVPWFDHLTTSFLADLERVGWAPDTVDAVVCTHLHVDHVGWNTRLEAGRWVPTFPNARYFMVRSEVEHAEREAASLGADHGAFAASMMDPANVFADSVKPIIESGQSVLVDSDAELAPGVRLLPTPGHTPGHVSVLLESDGQSAVITGDMMHHPCQIARPQWSSAFDSDPAISVETRHRFFERFADTSALVIGTHFNSPTAGYLVSDDGGYRLDVSR